MFKSGSRGGSRWSRPRDSDRRCRWAAGWPSPVTPAPPSPRHFVVLYSVRFQCSHPLCLPGGRFSALTAVFGVGCGPAVSDGFIYATTLSDQLVRFSATEPGGAWAVRPTTRCPPLPAVARRCPEHARDTHTARVRPLSHMLDAARTHTPRLLSPRAGADPHTHRGGPADTCFKHLSLRAVGADRPGR